MCHTFSGDRNGANNIVWMMERGAIETKGNQNLSGLGVSSGVLCVPSGRRANAASMPASCGTSLLFRSSQAGSILNVDERCPIQKYRVKARTLLSSGVGLAKDRVTYWVPQIPLM